VEDILWPDAIVIGGGISKKAGRFFPLLTVRTPLFPAALRNEAGIVGAALAARFHAKTMHMKAAARRRARR
jgi:polyphosphate glucokinase